MAQLGSIDQELVEVEHSQINHRPYHKSPVIFYVCG